MSLSKSLSDYADVKPILDRALAHRGGAYRLASHGQAVYWRQRAYKYRKLLRDLRGEARVAGQSPDTPYDGLVMDVEGDEVRFGWREPTGAFVAPTSEPATFADLVSPEHFEEDPLEAAARKLVEERGE